MKNKALPGQSEQPEESVCAHCGRYVGPVTKCGYCGAPVRSRLSLRIFRWAAVLLATVGLALLYYMSTMQKVPVVEIGSIKNTMNFAYIHVEGSVPTAPRVYREGDNVSSVSFMVDDGTGRIPVKAYGKNAQKLIATRKLPRAGDRIAIDGSLNVSADRKVLYLQVPEKVEILDRHEIPAVRIGDLNAEMQGDMVRVIGTIKKIAPPDEERHPWKILLADGEENVELAIWQATVDGVRRPELLQVGTLVEVLADVSVYRGELQLAVNRAGDIHFLKKKEVAEQIRDDIDASRDLYRQPVSVKDVTMADADSVVTVAGRLGRPISIKGGVLYYLYDDSGKIKVVLWDSQVKGGTREQLRKGVDVRVTGEVNIYKDELEIVPRDEHDIVLVDQPAEE